MNKTVRSVWFMTFSKKFGTHQCAAAHGLAITDLID
jgi:hypothetical protein